MDLPAFIDVVDPYKVRVVEREHSEGEAKLLDFTIGRIVPLLLVALAHVESVLEASVDKLFDEGGSTEQGDSTADGGHDAEIGLVNVVEDTSARNVTVERPKHPRKKRPAITNASGSSHLPKKLKGDHSTSSGAATSGKFLYVLKELLASSILNVVIGVEAVATLSLITSLLSATLEREDGNPTDSITGHNLYTIGPSEKFVISSDSSHHSSINASGAVVNSIIRSVILYPVMTEAVVTSHAVSAPSIPVPEMGTKITPSVHAFMFHDTNSIKIARANVLNDSRLDDFDVSREFVDHLAPPLLFFEICEMDYHHLFMEFSVRTARQACLNAKVRMRTEYCLSERSRDDEIENLKAQLLLKEAEATEDRELKDFNVVISSPKSQNDGLVEHTTCSSLRDQVSGHERLKEQIEEFQDAQMNIVNGRSLEDVVIYNPAAKADFNSTLQRLCEVDFPLLSKPRSHKDASAVDIMNLILLEGSLADVSGISDLQPDVEQLTLPIYRPKDQVVLYETTFSLSLSIAHSLVKRIRENVAAQLSACIDVWIPLVDPLSAENLIGAASTSVNVPATVVTTTALSTTFASTSSVPPITIDAYEIVSVDGQEDARGDVQGNVQGDVASSPTIAACSLLSSNRSGLIPKASSFCTISTSIVLSVGMPIFAGITASVPYDSEKGVSTLVDLIM
nr:hypothetical protein [Tanacetum cinerariifolium]GEY18931.1 hypothetical protein [Tanacetum cinerariifolium]